MSLWKLLLNLRKNKFEDTVKRILKDVDHKMIELENEYKKRLNYYKGFRENRKFVDSKYDRVFGALDEEPIINRAYEDIYSETDTEECHVPRELNITPYNLKRGADSKSTISPLRRKYTGLDSDRLWEHHRAQVKDAYIDKKVRFADNEKANRSFSQSRSDDFNAYKNKTYKR